MFCSKCGSKAPDNARFCTVCGASLYGAPILQIVKDAEGNESIEVIAGAQGIPEKKEEQVPVLQMSALSQISAPAAKPKETADRMYQDAEALMTYGDYALAANGFKKMTAAYPDDWRGWFGELRADILHHLDKNRYDISYTYASAKEHELMKKALGLNPNAANYAGFFETVLPEWESKPHMFPLHKTAEFGHGFCMYSTDFSEPSLDDRNVGAESYIRASRPEYKEFLIFAREGTYYNPDSFMCWFVKKNGIGDMIRMLQIPALTARADGLTALFRDGYQSGKLIGPNYSACPELDEKAFEIQEKHRGDFNGLVRLVRGFGINAKYHQMAKQLILQLPGERDERRFTEHGYTVVGRTVEIACENTDGRMYCLLLVYPEGNDPLRYLK